LNLISIAFAVLYIGLGVDYAIHLCLRTQEIIRTGVSRDSAVINSVRCLGPSLILCCLTTSMGFYSFVPTAYQGVSELGIISGTAMFIGLFITLSLLPALLVTLPGKAGPSFPESSPIPRNWHSFPIRHRRSIKISTALVALCSIWSLSDITFDFDPISLRDQGAESVTTFRELLKNKETSPLVISVIANNEKQARKKIGQLQQLDSVGSVISILDFIPENQEEKLEIIEALDESLGPLMGDFPPLRTVDVHRQTGELGTLLAILDSNGDAQAEHAHSETAGRLMLRHQLRNLLVILEQSTKQEKQELLATIQKAALENLAGTIAKLKTALNASAFDDLNALPEPFLRRWLSQDGLFRLQVQPRKDLNDLDNLREFVEQVREVAPNASDLPVIYLESGKEVVRAFQQAMAYAVIAISLISFIVLGNIRETGLVLMPLFLTALLTGASTVLFDNPFNFANIIVLPLLLGLGVDSSIHIVHRLRLMQYQQSEILKTSTARGIFFSGLTTVFSFTSLAFISHAGTASLGLLLTIGILLTLTCTLVVLPAFAVKPKPSFS
jgi:hopanoid biosynthesis associated RND transporter like protein HpnN